MSIAQRASTHVDGVEARALGNARGQGIQGQRCEDDLTGHDGFAQFPSRLHGTKRTTKRVSGAMRA